MSSAAILIENISESGGILGSKRAFACSIRYSNSCNFFQSGTYIFGSSSTATSLLQVLSGLVLVKPFEDKFRVEYFFSSDEVPQTSLSTLDISYGPFDDLESATISSIRVELYAFIQNNLPAGCEALDLLFRTFLVHITKLNNYRNNEVLWFCGILSLFFLDHLNFQLEARDFLKTFNEGQFHCLVVKLCSLKSRRLKERFFLMSTIYDPQLSDSQQCLSSEPSRFSSLDELRKNVGKNSVIAIYGHGSLAWQEVEIQIKKHHKTVTPTEVYSMVRKIGKKINTLVLVACNSDDISRLNDVKFLIKHNKSLAPSSYYVITMLLQSRSSKGLTGRALYSYLCAYLFACTFDYADFEIIVNDHE